MRVYVIAACLAAATPVAADDTRVVTVEVGQTVERNVGYARGGWMCDDPSLLDADLITRDDANIWIVTGRKAGSTQCRVGYDLHRPSLVFDVVVTPRRGRPAVRASRTAL